jgi:hypothetical protein
LPYDVRTKSRFHAKSEQQFKLTFVDAAQDYTEVCGSRVGSSTDAWHILDRETISSRCAELFLHLSSTPQRTLNQFQNLKALENLDIVYTGPSSACSPACDLFWADLERINKETPTLLSLSVSVAIPAGLCLFFEHMPVCVV